MATTLEAAWSLAEDDTAWLRTVAESIAPTLDQGVGVQAFRVRFEGDRHTLLDAVLVGGTSAWQAVWRQNWWDSVMRPLDAASMHLLLEFGVVSSAQQLWDAAERGAATLDAHLRMLSARGWNHAFARSEAAPCASRLFYVDSLNLCAVADSGDAVAVVANREEPLTLQEIARSRRALAPVSAHLTAALRARAALGGGVTNRVAPSLRGEAVLGPGGALLHAEGLAKDPDARATLREAARNIDRARAHACRENPDTVLDLWRCLLDGRWSLVEEFQSDGRRYMVAVPNAPRPMGRPLTTRESHALTELGHGRSNKEIAYALGLAPTTVATLLSRAARKLGARSRVELVRHARRLTPVELAGAPGSSGRPE